MLKILTILSFIMLSGCTSWPPSGHGGMAEQRIGTLSPVMPDEPIGPEHGLRFELELVSRHLDILVLEGAELCFPATVIQAKQRQDRITREIYGELSFDAANDLIIQRKLLARLERQLDYVREHNVCTFPIVQGDKKPTDSSKRIFDLLNSDNQFAFNSSELNPKYVVRLSQAVQLLGNMPEYILRITGHADIVGEKSHNLTLSLERAKKVGRYLQILGLNPKHIEFDAVGSKQPLFKGDNTSAHTRLVNRRVSIELIEKQASSLKLKDIK